MKKYLVKKVSTGEITNVWTSESNLDETYYEENFGKPERIVDDVEGSYDPADVLEHIDLVVAEAVPAVLDEQGNVVTEEVPAVIKKQVKLKAQYTIEIVDISQEHALQECIAKRKAEYPTMEEFLNTFFDGSEEDMQALHAKRLAVKDKYPKPVK